MSSIARLLLAASLLLGAFSAHVGAEAQPEVSSSSEVESAAAPGFRGTFRHVESDAEARSIEAAIERSVSDVNFVIRGATRRYLRRKSLPPQSIVFSPGEGHLELRWGETRRWRGLADGRSRLNRREDKPDRWISVRINGRELVQVVRQEGNHRTTSFRLSEDGQRMTVNVRVRSDRLGEDLRLRMTFRRTD